MPRFNSQLRSVPMLSVEDALQQIIAHVHDPVATTTHLGQSLGEVLAERIVADADSPPFDKALMDGYAVRSSDVSDGQAVLKVIEEVMAGQTATQVVAAGQAIRIMTGAPMPVGADAVIQVEHTELLESDSVRIDTSPTTAGRNVMPQGTSTKAGDEVVAAGSALRPQVVGALAELGRAEISAYTPPRVAVISTGDELVTIGETPGPGQIRNSNGAMLVAQITRAGGVPVEVGIARDERSDLRAKIEAGLECDVMLLSGGVSAGKLDLVPSELEAAGVERVFHKVKVKPGKPIWFGVRSAAKGSDGKPTYVFGLPGNPVSSMVCFELFARTAIRKLRGENDPMPLVRKARLSQDHLARGDRPTYYPARFDWADDGPWVTPVNWHGSADLRATVYANCMIQFPAGDQHFQRGDHVELVPWDDA